MTVKYYKVDSERLNYPAYYAAYSIADAKEVAHSDFNSQIRFEIKEVNLEDIPEIAIVHTAKLSRDDARKFVKSIAL